MDLWIKLSENGQLDVYSKLLMHRKIDDLKKFFEGRDDVKDLVRMKLDNGWCSLHFAVLGEKDRPLINT